MDTQQIIGFGVANGSLSYASSYPSVQSTPTMLAGSLKFGLLNSPDSPFSTQADVDTDVFTSLSDSCEQFSSADPLSGVSTSCNSSLDESNYFHTVRPSLGCCAQESLLLHPANLLSRNAIHRPKREYTLQELETVLMGPDAGEDGGAAPNLSKDEKKPHLDGQRSTLSSMVLLEGHSQQSFGSSCWKLDQEVHVGKRHRTNEPLQGVPPGNLKHLLIECARALSDNRIDDFDILVEQARAAVSISGNPLQRLGAYMVEGLVARKQASGTNIYRALRCKEPDSNELLSYMHILYEICPYMKFGYMAANGAIAEACRNEDRIHIIDFQIAQGTQWTTLLQALAARPSGAPHVRITGIDDPVSKYARGDGLEAVGRRLAAISEKFNIPVEFHPVPVFARGVTVDMLDVRQGEALAVNFPLQLHHIPDESVDVNNPRDGLLRMVKSLSPKVVTLVEQESNTNTNPFFSRFVETLEFYSAMFESIDVGVNLPRGSRDRINVEQHCLARDIVNIVACEGKERVERHELLGKWKSRLTMAGFRQYSLSSYVNSVIRCLLRRYSEYYSLEEKDGAMLLGWKNRKLISASAWY